MMFSSSEKLIYISAHFMLSVTAAAEKEQQCSFEGSDTEATHVEQVQNPRGMQARWNQ